MDNLLTMDMVDDDMKEDSATSVLLDSHKSKQIEEAFSLEDIAWVDSCLIKDDEQVSDSDWSSLKEALFEVITLHTDPRSLSTVEQAARFEAETINIDERSYCDDVDDKQVENNGDDLQVSTGKSNLKNVFRPNYHDGVERIESCETGLDSDASCIETESSLNDIFKVWDLGIFAEEDEFTKELNKATAERPLPAAPDSIKWKDVISESIDDLVAGIENLSLDRNLS